MLLKMTGDLGTTDVPCKKLELRCLATELNRRLRDPFVLHDRLMHQRRRSRSPQSYVPMRKIMFA